MMRSTLVVMIGAAGLSVSGCATNDRMLERTAAGAAIGAAAGAGVGAVTDVGVAEGAAVDAVAGGVIGAATAGRDPHWHRDGRGYCNYVDRNNRRIYDYDRRC